MSEPIEGSQIWTPDNYRDQQRALIKELFPPQKARGNLTSQQFFILLYYILDIEQPDLIIAPAYPRYLLPGTEEFVKTMDDPVAKFRDTITYKITREEPGSFGGDKQPFGTTRELNPRIREESVVNGEKSRRVFGQWFDTLVQFDCWTLTNYEADQLALWFKRFMTKYRDFFKHMGLSEIHFWWRGEDEVTRKLRNSLNFRTLVYFIRTEEISIGEDPVLKEIQYKVEQKIEREGGL